MSTNTTFNGSDIFAMQRGCMVEGSNSCGELLFQIVEMDLFDQLEDLFLESNFSTNFTSNDTLFGGKFL